MGARLGANRPNKPKSAVIRMALNVELSEQPEPVAGLSATTPEPSRSAPAPKLPSKEQYWLPEPAELQTRHLPVSDTAGERTEQHAEIQHPGQQAIGQFGSVSWGARL